MSLLYRVLHLCAACSPDVDAPVLPPLALFRLPPDAEPAVVPPPADALASLQAPFAIPPAVYRGALSPAVPVTAAVVYAATVLALNAYNRRHGHQPWRVSGTRAFAAFVVVHNIALALFSGLTCLAMVRAMRHVLPHPREPAALLRTVDALCKLHGPRGLGDAVSFDTAAGAWTATNARIRLGRDGSPDPTDVGRIWNEGLAFWGWVFYMSKFYEVVDTFIVLAKGRRSTVLQTYHHTGAVLSVWAGIRYMSPPIWMFVLVNAGIHAAMYAYYAAAALRCRVPRLVKGLLTTAQMVQLVVGSSFAAAHLFVRYSMPVTLPLAAPAAAVASAVEAVSAGLAADAAAATTSAADLLRKLAYRAAGEAGLAENAHAHVPPAPAPAPVADAPPAPAMAYTTEHRSVHCIDTSGQSFAIWLNVAYILPLTLMFAHFFARAYLGRTAAGTDAPTSPRARARAVSKAGCDALHGVERELGALGRSAENALALDQRSQHALDALSRRVSRIINEDAELSPAATQKHARRVASDVMSKAAASPRAQRASRARRSSDTAPPAGAGADADANADADADADAPIAGTHIAPLADANATASADGASA